MDDRRCGTCKHWVRTPDRRGTHFGECGSEKFVYSVYDPTPIDGLRYWDTDDYMASFNTGENFGCNAWEAKCA